MNTQHKILAKFVQVLWSSRDVNSFGLVPTKIWINSTNPRKLCTDAVKLNECLLFWPRPYSNMNIQHKRSQTLYWYCEAQGMFTLLASSLLKYEYAAKTLAYFVQVLWSSRNVYSFGLVPTKIWIYSTNPRILCTDAMKLKVCLLFWPRPY